MTESFAETQKRRRAECIRLAAQAFVEAEREILAARSQGLNERPAGSMSEPRDTVASSTDEGDAMTVQTNEPLEPASTQYNDFRGTAAADGHYGSPLLTLAEEVGLDTERYMIVGLQFGHRQLKGKDGLTIFAVDRSNLGGLTLDQYATRHGEIPVTDFVVHDITAIDLLARGLKRFSVQLIARSVPEGVSLRRTVLDDLNYVGE